MTNPLFILIGELHNQRFSPLCAPLQGSTFGEGVLLGLDVPSLPDVTRWVGGRVGPRGGRPCGLKSLTHSVLEGPRRSVRWTKMASCGWPTTAWKRPTGKETSQFLKGWRAASLVRSIFQTPRVSSAAAETCPRGGVQQAAGGGEEAEGGEGGAAESSGPKPGPVWRRPRWGASEARDHAAHQREPGRSLGLLSLITTVNR